MPYIKHRREEFDQIINQLPLMENKGELEYVVFKIAKLYMKQVPRQYRYSTLHNVVYAVIHAGEEFKRRYLDVREDLAKKTNGDIT